jgi:hypothetical protein
LREHSEHIARQDQTLLTMSQTVQLLSENVKVLTTLVNERTLHKP